MYIKRKIFNNFKIKKKINDIINLNNLFKNEKKQDKKKINNLFKNINNINAPLKKENTLNINDFLFKIELEKEEDLDFFDNAYDLITSIKQINNMYDFLYFFRKEKEKKQFTKTEMIAHIENINTLFIDFILATKKNIKKDNSLSLI